MIETHERPERFARAYEIAIVAAAVFVAAGIMSGFAATSFNNYTYLGDAFVHGRLWVDTSGDTTLSVVPFGDHFYVIEPPMPGILMMPLSLFFHTQANQTLLAIVLLTVGAAACWSFLRRLRLTKSQAALISSVLLFATPYFYGGFRGDVWQLASVCAVTFSFLLLDEVVGSNRPTLVATYALAAGLSRSPLLPLVLVYFIFAARTFGVRYTLRYGAVAAVGAVAIALYDFGRWGTIFDIGYRLYEEVDTHNTAPMLGLGYLPMQIQAMFFAAPVSLPRFPWLVARDTGLGMLYTSAVFAFACFAPRGKGTVALWVATSTTLLPSLLYYDVGDEQFGFRHLLDFAPFLIALLALTIRERRWKIIYVVGSVNVVCGIVWMIGFYEMHGT